ncbi:oligopeptide ABC transporter ATP-binding protein [Devosia pacifica]|uniref:Oligopeptide ABC transporter ATP-binding protein n=1 Tax=Devosia pacifica TaxID=1335967 RepID=A0A918S5T8_9HYPH|nr:oligopeptide/dipeptide ABC transporter ATP-binding protein [Devosia pacifica]GHA24951.1 oligopeptide ABC transporter ATP-binding protein [Devosia pacifica]
MNDLPSLSVRKLTKLFSDPDRPDAISVGVRGVSFDVERGEVVGLIGESGCGKTTLGRCIVGLQSADSGDIVVGDTIFSALRGKALRRFRKNVQIVFQRPETSLNPRMSVYTFVRQALRNFATVRKGEERVRIEALAALVGLRPDTLDRFPHQLSGGERQRVAMMRALACEPELIVLDEPTSALDVSVQAQVLRTLKDLQGEVGASFLFISHDVAVVRYICSRVLVMYLGVIVEEGPSETVLAHPVHPYTQALLAAAPRITPKPDPGLSLTGELVLGDVRPHECPVRPRCPLAHDRCHKAPPMADLSSGHRAACWLAHDSAPSTNMTTARERT